MSKMSVFVAEGLEEVECLSAVDIARRGGVDVTMVSVTGDLLVTGANDITLKADILFEDGDFSDSDLLFLPDLAGLLVVQGPDDAGHAGDLLDVGQRDAVVPFAIPAESHLHGHMHAPP